MTSPHSPFRPDLEGLRGVAILLVVLFHAGVPAAAGGFVGVDVFFVLSGFFITGLLLRERAHEGGVALSEFWSGRALRLLPSLLVVLLATLGLVMWLWAPIDRAAIAASARSVALSSANFEFASRDVNYFSHGENPLLHTWSLAVEEQFYLVWPLVFLLLAMLAERWSTGRRPRGAEKPDDPTSDPADGLGTRGLLLGLGAVAAVSLAASLLLTRTAQPWAFFGTPTRLWEFALGGMVAVWARERRIERRETAAVLQVAGLSAIALAVARFDSFTPYPGAAALLPALGATLVVAAGPVAADGFAGRALSAGWLRWLGRVSYGWYLWHWPLVGLGGVLDPRIGVPGKLAWSGVALVLAWATHRWIEGPARDVGRARISAHRLPLVALGASVAAALLAHGAMLVGRGQAASPEQRAFAAAREDRMRHDCWVRSLDDMPAGPCEFGDRSSSTTVALLGDSHAEHWLGALDRVGKERGWKIVAMVKGGCPVADMRGLIPESRAAVWDECTRYREAMLRRIVAMRPTVVLLSSWNHYVPVDGAPDRWQVSVDAWRTGLRRTYERLTAAGLPVVAMRGTPRTWFDVPVCLSRRAAGLPFAGACTYDRAESLPTAAIAAQTSAARGLPMRFVDMNDRICSTPRCPAVRDGIVVFTDDNHITASYSRAIAPVLSERLAGAARELGARLP